MKWISALLVALALQTTGQSGLLDQMQGVLDQLRGSFVPATVAVTTATELQAALNGAVETVVLAPGTYTGNFVLPAKTTPTVIRGAAGPAYTVINGRAVPTTGRPKIVAANQYLPAISIGLGVDNYTFEGVEITGVAADRNVVEIGVGALTLADFPENITFDRVWIHGTTAPFGKRGIYFDAINGVVRNSIFTDFVRQGQDSNAVLGNGPGPYLLEGSWFEASGEGVMFGGVDPRVSGLIPSDITVRNNVFYKPLEWKIYAGSVKNAFELKNARRVTITGNWFKNSWVDAQAGHSVVLTVRNQDGGCPWCNITDVVVACNVIETAAGQAVNILGTDNIHPSGAAENITVSQNLMLGTAGGVMVGNSVKNLIVTNNVMVGITSTFLRFYGTRVNTPFTFTGNRASAGTYGLFGDSLGSGTPALAYAPGYVFTGNTIERSVPFVNYPYPAGNTVGVLAGTVVATDWSCTP
jgi:hypothetical protein